MSVDANGQLRITLESGKGILPRKVHDQITFGERDGYQTLIKAALRESLDGQVPRCEETLRRIIREELKSSAA